jgi:archaellum component FlaF (FlaF/FlaG flagellin family)
MRKNQDGFVVEILIGAVIILLLFMIFFVRFQGSNETVSGIAYNTTNDHFLSGNTSFSVRASESTYVSEENQSTYCLPPNSPYKALVNKAAEDKRIKIVVTAKKYFAVQAPWVCKDNVTVTEVK